MFDTQVAAGFAGLGAQSSYDSLLAEVLGLRVAKTASFTRWDARPLSAEQLAYAREDVVHLLELAAELERRLTELGPARVGARGVRAAVARQRRARPADDLRTAAARRRPERLGAGRSRGSWWSGASRRPSARTGRSRACSATRASSRWRAAARLPGGPDEDPRHRARAPAAAGRASCSMPSARARSRPEEPPPQRRPPAAAEAGGPAAGRAGGGARCERGRAKPGSPTSCSPRARTCRRSSPPCAWARSRRTSARCAAGAQSLRATTCSTCSKAACGCPSSRREARGA